MSFFRFRKLCIIIWKTFLKINWYYDKDYNFILYYYRHRLWTWCCRVCRLLPLPRVCLTLFNPRRTQGDPDSYFYPEWATIIRVNRVETSRLIPLQVCQVIHPHRPHPRTWAISPTEIGPLRLRNTISYSVYLGSLHFQRFVKQGSILSSFYAHIFCTKVYSKPNSKQLQKRLLYKKCVRKMLMKLTSALITLGCNWNS